MNASAARPVPDILLVKAVFGLNKDRLACQECLAGLPAYVDAEIVGSAHRTEHQAIKRHVLLCSDCHATYLELLKIAILDQRNQLPDPFRYPLPDLSFLSGVRSDE